MVQKAGDEIAIADVAANEQVTRIALERGQVAEISGIGQLVEIDDWLVAAIEPVENEIGTNETGASGHQNHAHSMRRAAFASRALIKRRILSRT